MAEGARVRVNCCLQNIRNTQEHDELASEVRDYTRQYYLPKMPSYVTNVK